MGKRIIAQRRGRGTMTYRTHGFNYEGCAKLPSRAVSGIVKDIITCRAHSAPLIKIRYDNNKDGLLIAPENIKVGDTISIGNGEIATGNTLPLCDMNEGMLIYNIEARPGDGGKFVRASGTFAKILNKLENNRVIVALPSKRKKTFHGNCRASIGVVAGGGRTEKPIMKAGTKFYKMKAKNKLWPKVSGHSMNAVDHPFGNKRSSRKSKARPCPRSAPPGRKVGYIAARRTGQGGKKRRER
jgi:large subunit ribosomal protein L2